ncbi:MAG: SMP-30/gluconolactonase/LRE family protein [Actinomycetota bacterium]
MVAPSIDVVLPVRARLGECPVWDDAADVLWWIDIDSRRLHRTDPLTGVDEVAELGGRPGSVVLTRDPGRLVAGVEHHVVDVDWPSGVTTRRVRAEDGARVTRLNDGRCDPRGRYWVGSMQDPPESATFAGGLYRIDAATTPDAAGDALHVELDSGVGITNGLAFAPDGRTMYWADTAKATVWAYDYDLDTGRRSNERVFASFDGTSAPGLPDGACVDADGCYWVACVTGSAVARLTPTGELDRVIEVPMTMPTMPAFGGPDLSTMYVTSIGGDGDRASARPDDPMAGALLAIDVGVVGLREPRFAG